MANHAGPVLTVMSKILSAHQTEYGQWCVRRGGEDGRVQLTGKGADVMDGLICCQVPSVVAGHTHDSLLRGVLSEYVARYGTVSRPPLPRAVTTALLRRVKVHGGFKFNIGTLLRPTNAAKTVE